MDELEVKLIELLEKRARNMSLSEIVSDLNLNDAKIVEEKLSSLEKRGKIFRNKKNEFLKWHNGLGRKYGTIKITKRGMGVLTDEEDNVFFINKEFLNGALSGDRVIIKDLKKINNRQEGKVERVLDRHNDNIVAEVVSYSGKKVLRSIENNKIINVEDGQLQQYVMGDRVLIKINIEQKNDKYSGKVLKKLCHRDDPNKDLITIAANHGFDIDFPGEVKEEVKLLPNTVRSDDLIGRVDLRDEIIFTIDGADTKDIDDSISLELLPNGHYKLGVHIADVANYVKEGSAVYKEALKRGTSVYMVDKVIPMLPRELSNGICSLNEGVDRLTKTCEMEIDKNGHIISSKIFDSVINSKKKMTYEDVNRILDDGIIPQGYEQFVPTLQMMHKLSQKMEKNKLRRGAVEIDNKELKLLPDDCGKICDVEVKEQKSAEKLIENFMLAANASVAKTMADAQLPFIYRVHDLPNREKMMKMINTICHIDKSILKPKFDMTNSKNIQFFLDILHDYKEYYIYSNLILRGLNKAIYSEENIGHFALAMDWYTHFTSPIRRFPDLLVHQLINTYRNGKCDEMQFDQLKEKIAKIALKSSQQEVAAQEAEYEALDMKTAEYMKDHIGEEYPGMITDINEHGMRVVLDNLISGTINIHDLHSKEYCVYDKNSHTLMSDAGDYHLGDKILVKVINANKETHTINFESLGLIDSKNIKKMKIKKNK